MAAVLRATAGWPSDKHENLVLIGILILALIPIFLVVLGTASSVQAFGLRLQFPEARHEVREVAVSPSMGLLPGIALIDSSTAEIIETLRNATRNEVAVVDIEDGTAWWESRLLVLCAGAARLQRPKAIVFLATMGDSGPGVYRGWAPPADLLGQLLARPDLASAYHRAMLKYRQAQEPPASLRTDHERYSFIPERLLAAEVGQEFEVHGNQRLVTVARLDELFEPVLRRAAADVDATPGTSESWEQRILSTEDAFVALTRCGRYQGMFSREKGVNDILRAILKAQT
ncbi:hypothetical protein [Streptomyces alanosinicus]|uniref:hypothetical protein n=1 Tax=Streptomyces alanosinicus TaxID=68171 RepID=UPI001671B886|nr:hypothetical protein [Streptomyces alanosinicus]